MAVIDHESQHRRSPGCFFPTDLALKGANNDVTRRQTVPYESRKQAAHTA